MLADMEKNGELDNLILDAITDFNNSYGIRFTPMKGEGNASYNTRKLNELVNNLKTKLIDSGIASQKVKWSIPTINITLPAGEYYFNGFDIVQGLNLKGAGKNATIIYMLEPAKIKYVYQQTLANGVGNVNISDIFFYGNDDKTINCFEPVLTEKTERYAHLIYSTIHDCSFYGFDQVFKVIGYNNSIYNNTFNWCNRCIMIYGYDNKGNVGGDWAIYCNSANNIKEFITSLFSSLIHAHDNWLYQGLGKYINLIGWNRGSVIENNRLEDTTTNIYIHGGFVVKHNENIYIKKSNVAGEIGGNTWELLNDYDINFIEPYSETKSYNILQAIAIMIRNNNLHTPSENTLEIYGGQYITVKDNYSGNYVKQTAIIENCQGLQYHNNLYIEYTPKFYDDYKEWKAINSFNVKQNLTVGTPENYMNVCYTTSSPRGFLFRINDSVSAFRVTEGGSIIGHNNAKVVTLNQSATTTVIELACANSQSVVITPRNKSTAQWYANNIGNVFAECGNGNVAITHPSTTETLIFNVIVL